MPELPMISPGGGIEPARPVLPPMGPGAGVEALKSGLDDIESKATELGAHFARMRRLNQFNLAQAEHADNADEVTIGPEGVLNDPKFRTDPEAARVEAQSRLDGMTQQLLQKYPLADYDGMLSRNLAIRNRGIARSVWLHAHTNAEQDARDGTEAAEGAALNTALNNSDPKERAMAVGNYLQLLDAHTQAGLFTPGQHDQLVQRFQTKLAVGVMQNRVASDPTAAALELNDPDFAGKHPGVGPEERMTLLGKAIEMQNAPIRQVDAEFNTKKAGAMEQLMQQSASGGSVLGDAQKAYERGLISGDEFKYVTGGQKPSEPDDPDVVGNLREMMRDAPLSVESSDIYRAGVSHKTATELARELRENQRQANTDIGNAARELRPRLEAEFFPADKAMFSMNPKEDEEQKNQFRADFTTMVKEAKSVGDVYRIREQLAKIYQAPGAKGGMAGIKPPPPNPGETPGAYGGRLRAMGF